jgi:hypothetical protein
MADEEVSANNKNEDLGTPELNSWMRARMEERARPLSSQGLHRSYNGSRLTNSVAEHVGMSDALSRDRRLTFLTGAYRGILRKVGRTETPELFKMIDLPWFRIRDVSRQGHQCQKRKKILS